MPKIDHIVLLQLQEGTPPEKADQILSNFLDISENIPGIENFISGPNTSSEGRHRGYTHAFIMRFRDALARDAYLRHPEHKRVQKLAEEVFTQAIVIDIEL